MKKLLSIAICLFAYFCALTQVEKNFQLPNQLKPAHIAFSMSCPSGKTVLRHSQNPSAIKVNGVVYKDEGNAKFNYKASENGSYAVSLNTSEATKLGWNELGEDHSKDTWQIFLNEDTSFDLDFRYGLGDSYLDLSDVAVSNLNIETGHANVNVKYQLNQPNTTKMKTFNANVNMGALKVENLDLSKAEDFNATVSIGSLTLGFSDKATASMNIAINLGAGNCNIKLPTKHTAVKILANDEVKMPKGFYKMKGYYVNSAYLMEDYEYVLTFDFNVSLGKVNFL